MAVRMPGGEAAVKFPWRMALSWLASALGEEDAVRKARALGLSLDESEARLVLQAADKGIGSPLTSSAGRLFDAAAAIAGVRSVCSYEGQAACEFEALASGASWPVSGASTAGSRTSSSR